MYKKSTRHHSIKEQNRVDDHKEYMEKDNSKQRMNILSDAFKKAEIKKEDK